MESSRLFRGLLAFGALVVAASPSRVAFAVNLPARFAPAVSFMETDRNGDLVIDEGEAATVPGLPVVFAQADLNRDRRLTGREFVRALTILGSRR